MSAAPEAPLNESAFQRFLMLQIAVAGAITAGSLLWAGVDFAAGALIGSAIAVLNLVWTKNVVRRFLQPNLPQPRFVVYFVIKFAASVGLLYVAILDFSINPIGIAVGVSSLVVASFVTGIVRLGS